MAVEILENTLLKLLVRRGTDADRRLVTLSDGELGYTTDTERLFVGNSATGGGVVVGNKYQGSAADLTSLAPCVTGDYAFETDTNEFKIVTSGSGAQQADWTIVATYLSAGDNTLTIDSKNHIIVGKFSAGGGLSADNISPTALGDSITLDAFSRVSLSARINIDGITKRSASSTYLSLPAGLKIGTLDYDWPANDPTSRSFLGSDANNNLRWTIPSIVDSAIAPTSGAVLPVGTIVPFASAFSGKNPIPYGWLNCNGASIAGTDYRDLSAVIGISYGGDTTNPDTATTFKVPDLTNKLIYGSFVNDTAGSSLYPMASGVGLSAGPLSAAGVNFIIKSVGGVSSPTLTVGKNLSAFVNGQDKSSPSGGVGTAFDFLSGAIRIEKTPPGQVTFETPGTHAFTMPDGVHFVKYYVTGSGATGGRPEGGAGTTCIGYLSAGYRTRFTLEVAAAPPHVSKQVGSPSIIAISGTDIVTAGGGIYLSRFVAGAAVATGTIELTNDHILNGYIAVGGGGQYRQNTKAFATGIPSFWGSLPNPGAGQGAHHARPYGAWPGPGMIMLEWT